jgi:hypothetical protein
MFFPGGGGHGTHQFTRTGTLVVLYAHIEGDPKVMQQYTISPIISAKRRQEVIILLFHIQQ